MGMRHFLNLLLLLGFTGFLTADANGQLLYSTVNNSNQQILRQINLDGTGDVVFNIPGLATASSSVFSNDGRLIGVRGQTPAQTANQVSFNIFVFDPTTNQTRQISNNVDVFDPNTGIRTFTDTTGKSFSPDGTLLAVANCVTVIFPPTPDSPSTSANRRFMTFFRVSDGQQLGARVDDSGFSGSSTGGDGVSWSPVADVIAYPTTTFNPANPLLSGPTPISAFNSAGQFLGNLTSPTSGGFLEQFIEHDQFPAFSPDGQQLAYFRQRRFVSGFSGPSQLELRIAGVAQPILSFDAGQLPSGLSWSPDGTQLAFSVGKQGTEYVPGIGTFFEFNPNPGTLSVGIVNADGSSPTPFLSPIAASPEYFPETTSTVRLGDVSLDGTVNFLDISPFIAALSTGEFQAEADIDQNGMVNFLDISPFIGLLSGQQ